VQLYGQHKVVQVPDGATLVEMDAAKTSAACFNGYEYRDGKRTNKTAEFLHTLFIDFDWKPRKLLFGALPEVLRVLLEQELRFLVYTTWSYSEANPSCRAVIPLEKSIAVDDQEALDQLWYWVECTFVDTQRRPMVDKSSRVLAQAMFVPSHASTSVENHIVVVEDGTLLSASQYRIKPVSEKRPPSAQVIDKIVGSKPYDSTSFDLDKVISKEYLRDYYSRCANKSPTTYAIVRAAKGKSLATPNSGNRHNTITMMLQRIAQDFGPQPPGVIAEFLAESFEVMGREADAAGKDTNCLDLDAAENSYEGALANKDKVAAEKQAEAQSEKELKTQELLMQFGVEEVPNPEFSSLGLEYQESLLWLRKDYGLDFYQEEEWSEWAKRFEKTFLFHRIPLILLNRGEYYLFCNGEYRWYDRKDAEKYFMHVLRVGERIKRRMRPITYTKPAGQLMVPINLDDAVQLYGQVVEDVEYSLVAQQEFAEHIMKGQHPTRLVRPLVPSLAVKAEYVYWADRFIEAFVEPKARDAFEIWCAGFTMFDHPLTALYLWGKPKTGKTWFANMLSRFWPSSRTPTNARLILETNFNEALIQCPLIFADEDFPEDKGAELRRAITQRSFTINAKFKAPQSVTGSPRWVIAANSPDILSFTGSTKDALDALAERITPVKAQEGAIKVLRDQKIDMSSPDTTRAFFQHFQWLREVRHKKHFEPENLNDFRCIVPAFDTEFFSQFYLKDISVSHLCQWLVMLLAEPITYLEEVRRRKNMTRTAQDAYRSVRVQTYVQFDEEGKLCVSPWAPRDMWDIYVNAKDRPPVHGMAKAFEVLGRKVKRYIFKRPDGSKARTTFYQIDMKHLESWVDKTGYYSIEDLARLRKHLPETLELPEYDDGNVQIDESIDNVRSLDDFKKKK
jgi:hypothetical protein